MESIDLGQVLKHLASNESGVRQQAESYFEQLKENSNYLPLSLLTHSCNVANDPPTRQMAIVLLRRLLIPNSSQESIFVRMLPQM
jgi:hypothetical protein